MTTSPELNWASDACTLPTVERPLREAEFDDLFTRSLRAARRIDATTAVLVLDPAAEEWARDLTARESSCCSFFAFTFDPSPEGVAMTVTVPEAYAEVLGALLERAESTKG